ncbi:Kelch-like protein 5 [Elasticomyces elasticus]|nr:Kelch-like protein 5 [Elasticomyces elasticus]
MPTLSRMEASAISPALKSPAERHYHAKCFFSSSNLSDVKIRFGGKNVDAHKIILARGSRYFERIFAGDGMVQYGRTVDLDDIDTEAAKGLLAWIYDTEYQRDDRYIDEAGLTYIPKTAVEAQQYAVYLIDLYVAANTYEVSKLAALVEVRVDRAFRDVIWQTRYGERAGARASEVASRLYTGKGLVKQGLDGLRRIFVNHFEHGYRTHVDIKLLEEMLLDCPGLAIDVLRRLARRDESH